MSDILSFELSCSETEALRRLFRADSDDKILFGISGFTNLEGLPVVGNDCWIDVKDYLMEGTIQYSVRTESRNNHCVLMIRLTGSNRDRYMASHISHNLKQFAIEQIT